MTEQIFFDNDCLSAFLWVGRENLITNLYRSRAMLPQQVYDELKRVNFLKTRIDLMVANGNMIICQLVLGTPEADLYVKLTTNPEPGFKLIGKGEAAAISLTKHRNGILGSNNMKDIYQYIELFKLKYITTGNILVEALKMKLITEGQGNVIWNEMKDKQRKLPTDTFSDFLAGKR